MGKSLLGVAAEWMRQRPKRDRERYRTDILTEENRKSCWPVHSAWKNGFIVCICVHIKCLCLGNTKRQWKSEKTGNWACYVSSRAIRVCSNLKSSLEPQEATLFTSSLFISVKVILSSKALHHYQTAITVVLLCWYFLKHRSIYMFVCQVSHFVCGSFYLFACSWQKNSHSLFQ